MIHISLETDRVIVRSAEHKDVDILMRLKNDFELQSLLLVQPKLHSKKDVIEWIDNKNKSEDILFCVIVDKSGKWTVGYIQIKDINHDEKHPQVGVCLDENYRNRGFFRESYDLLERYVKENYKIKKLSARIREDNQQSIRAFSRVGYKLIYSFKDDFVYNGKKYCVNIFEKELNE